MEIRLRSLDVECRDDGVYKIGGYVNVTERESELLYSGKRGKWFNEVVKQGAFKRSLQSGKEIPLLLEHDYEKRLADNKSNTLTLTEDQIGLRFDAEIRDKDVYEKVKSKQINNCSFGFLPVEQEFEDVTNLREKRYLKDIELLEISLVENPAYAGSLVEVRNLNEQEQKALEEKSSEEKTEEIIEETIENKEEVKEVEETEVEETTEEPEVKESEKPKDTEDTSENRGFVEEQIDKICTNSNVEAAKEIVNEIIKEKEEQLENAEFIEECVKEELEFVKENNKQLENQIESELLRRNADILKLRVQLLKLKSIN